MVVYADSCSRANWDGVREKALIYGGAISSESAELWPARNPQDMSDQAGVLQKQKASALSLNKYTRKIPLL